MLRKTEVHLSCVEGRWVIRINEQNILWFQISMRQFVLMQELHWIAQLVSDVTNMLHRIRLVIVFSLEGKSSLKS